MSPRLQPHGRHGYTLVELTIVVLTLGILAGVAAPRYRDSLASYQLDAAARRVVNDLRFVRQYARKASKVQSVQFDLAADAYAMPNTPSLDRPETTYSVKLGASQYGVDMTSADFGGAPNFQFDIYGRPSQSGTVLMQSNGKQRTVEVNSAGEIQTY